MEDKHWSDEELLAMLYGAGRDRDAHLDACAECTERWRLLRERREALIPPAEIPEQVLARQKYAIMRRVLKSRERSVWLGFPWRRTLAVAAVAAMLLIAIVLHNPAYRRQSPIDSASAAADSKLFTEVMYEAARTAGRAYAGRRAF